MNQSNQRPQEPPKSRSLVIVILESGNNVTIPTDMTIMELKRAYKIAIQDLEPLMIDQGEPNDRDENDRAVTYLKLSSITMINFQPNPYYNPSGLVIARGNIPQTPTKLQ